MKTSPAGIHLIEQFERFMPNIYRDEAGIPTVGYGHVVHPGEDFAVPLTREHAEAILMKDESYAEAAIEAAITAALTQNEYDALVSFTFNCGSGALVGSTLRKLLNAGDYDGAAEQFPLWCHVMVDGVKTVSAGLLARRKAEAALFLTPDTLNAA